MTDLSLWRSMERSFTWAKYHILSILHVLLNDSSLWNCRLLYLKVQTTVHCQCILIYCAWKSLWEWRFCLQINTSGEHEVGFHKLKTKRYHVVSLNLTKVYLINALVKVSLSDNIAVAKVGFILNIHHMFTPAFKQSLLKQVQVHSQKQYNYINMRHIQYVSLKE